MLNYQSPSALERRRKQGNENRKKGWREHIDYARRSKDATSLSAPCCLAFNIASQPRRRHALSVEARANLWGGASRTKVNRPTRRHTRMTRSTYQQSTLHAMLAATALPVSPPSLGFESESLHFLTAAPRKQVSNRLPRNVAQGRRLTASMSITTPLFLSPSGMPSPKTI